MQYFLTFVPYSSAKISQLDLQREAEEIDTVRKDRKVRSMNQVYM